MQRGTIAAAVELQAEYAALLDTLRDNQQGSALADALRAIVELDLSELRTTGDRTAKRLRTGLNNEMTHPAYPAWATITRGTNRRLRPRPATTAR
jgi:hypothetical protein